MHAHDTCEGGLQDIDIKIHACFAMQQANCSLHYISHNASCMYESHLATRLMPGNHIAHGLIALAKVLAVDGTDVAAADAGCLHAHQHLTMPRGGDRLLAKYHTRVPGQHGSLHGLLIHCHDLDSGKDYSSCLYPICFPSRCTGHVHEISKIIVLQSKDVKFRHVSCGTYS